MNECHNLLLRQIDVKQDFKINLTKDVFKICTRAQCYKITTTYIMCYSPTVQN